MEHLRSLVAALDILCETDDVLETVDELGRNAETDGGVRNDTRPSEAGDAPMPILRCMECNDGERAIVAGYVSLMRQCIELAEKVEAAKT